MFSENLDLLFNNLNINKNVYEKILINKQKFPSNNSSPFINDKSVFIQEKENINLENTNEKNNLIK